MGEPDLANIIFNFLSQLPKTIQLEILARVAIFAIQKDFDVTDDMLEHMRRHLLHQPGAVPTIGAVLATIAVLDLTLDSTVTNAAEYRANRELGASIVESLKPDLLSIPLFQKHMQQAYERWQGLRSGTITQSAIRAFADSTIAGVGR